MPKNVKGGVNLSFDNTEVAFAGKSDYDLKRAYWLFKLIGSNTLVKISKPFANLAVDLHLPIGPIVRQTLYIDTPENLIPVNILIADRNYRVKISPKDEEAVRKTAALINQKLVEYKSLYAGSDTQDYISMVLLWFTTEQQQNSQKLYEIEAIQAQIDSMSASIDKVLVNTNL
jgi:cell division protein ZapA